MILATDEEQCAVLQVMVEATNVARIVQTCAGFPVAATDPMLRRIQAANPDVLLVDIPTDAAADGGAGGGGAALGRCRRPPSSLWAACRSRN